MSEGLLPVHGFVLAGGKSSRMGTDKALLEVGGRAMVEIAVEKLRGFCETASIVGDRDDLSRFAPVVREERTDCGPAAGIEAGLRACMQPWAMFLPVDVPLMPGEFLRRWFESICAAEKGESSGRVYCASLSTREGRQPSFVLVRPEAARVISEEMDRGGRRLADLWEAVRGEFGVAQMVWCSAESIVDEADADTIERWFTNVNTPDDLEVLAALMGEG